MQRNQRGVAAPSLLVMLSIIAVAMAGIAFVATQDPRPEEKAVPISARETPEPTVSASPTAAATPRPKPKPKPAFDKARTMVEVFNNSRVKGLAASVGTKVSDSGWQVVGTDNWYGTVSGTTVYYPPRLQAAAKQLALDLGVKRVLPASDPMKGDRLTLILTGAL